MERVWALGKSFGVVTLLTLACAGLPLWAASTGEQLPAPCMALAAGGGILGASILLTWACEVAQNDMPQAMAVAVVAIVAVLPEYAVDMYFTWMAGQQPDGGHACYALANMTGANRLLIGMGWPAVVCVAALCAGTARVQLAPEQRVEMSFLLMASLYALWIAFKGTLALYDGCVYVGLYVACIARIISRGDRGEEAEGPAALIAAWPRPGRVGATVGLFVVASVVILGCAEPFSESLVATGRLWGLNEFLLVQWLAPIASETPEFVVALMFAARGRAALALTSLLAAKLNQWTLLVGMIPGVYAVSLGSAATPIPLEGRQLQEVLLTAGQSLFGLSLLWGLRLGVPAALALLALFLVQMTTPLYAEELAARWNLPAAKLRTFQALACLALALLVAGWRWWRARRPMFNRPSQPGGQGG